MRIFVAIELPESVRELAGEHIKLLRGEFPKRPRVTWEHAEKLHITLKFLGEVDENKVVALQSAAEKTAAAFEPFELAVASAGAFPKEGTPRVLWLGINDSADVLTRLQHKLEDDCAKAGFQKEPRKFRPHLTIARIRTPEGSNELRERHEQLEFQSETFTVNEIVVIQSELLPTGSQYTKLSTHKLSEPAADNG
jgi:2'-5' RNA ligase